MKLKLYQIDAFTAKLFEGNPAAVCPLDEWLPDDVLQNIAMENNLSETAFFVQENEGFRLRWFTPQTEVDLCGHATLATAYLLFDRLDYSQPQISFFTRSGMLNVEKAGGWYKMVLPVKPFSREAPPLDLYHALGGEIADEVYQSDDFMWVFDKEEKIRRMQPDFTALSKIETRGVIVTAPADDEDIDFVSRFFAPAVGINEDPVTGSAHTMLVPYWAGRFNKNQLTARQISKRGGLLKCALLNDKQVMVSGQARTYMEGVIEI